MDQQDNDNCAENNRAAAVLAWTPDQDESDSQGNNSGFEVRVDHYSELWIEEANLIMGNKKTFRMTSNDFKVKLTAEDDDP